MKYIGSMLIWTINVLLVGLLIHTIIENDNDKSPVVFILGYAVITIANLIVLGILKLLNIKFAEQLERPIILLSLLFVPLLLLVLTI